MKKTTWTQAAIVLLLGGAGSLYTYLSQEQSTLATQPTEIQTTATQKVSEAYQQQQSKIWVEIDTTVKKLLSDDNKGSRHQRFIVQISDRHTVLVAHNIDLAPRVPLREDDTLRIRGRYEYNDKGGVIHWTHADPKQKISGGWIELRGKKYQ